MIFQFYLCKMLKVGNTGKDGVHVFPHTNYQVVIPFRQVCKCLLQLLYPILSKWSDKEMKSRNVLVHDLKKKKGKYVLEFEIGIGLLWVLFFVGNSSCMRNTYYAKIHGQFFFPLLKVFPFNSSEWHCNHLLVRVLTLLHTVLPTLKSLHTYYLCHTEVIVNQTWTPLISGFTKK